MVYSYVQKVLTVTEHKGVQLNNSHNPLRHGLGYSLVTLLSYVGPICVRIGSGDIFLQNTLRHYTGQFAVEIWYRILTISIFWILAHRNNIIVD